MTIEELIDQLYIHETNEEFEVRINPKNGDIEITTEKDGRKILTIIK